MAGEIPDDARELLQNFSDLPPDDRARILSLVKSLNLFNTVIACRADLYFSRVTHGAEPSSGSTHRSPV
jgi:hypothetical protein